MYQIFLTTFSAFDIWWIFNVYLCVGSLLDRLVKLMDYYEGSFQDFVGHSDKVTHVKFAASAKLLFTIADSELFIWTVCV